ncbi:Spo0B C-terminal domain-containing protein [Bacillus salitolerans]|uniref:Spo0B C-terminal domain-containing protein n=1 Tax=Bacillus salitolerans TaxID=1437434 RepID=A0ABW4LMQ6_9BACI
MKEWSIVELLKQSRHDWLNKLQLIKGNLSLNRIERAKEIIEEIVIESQNEAKLTNMQLTEFAGFLMTYNWGSHHFCLEYEVLGSTYDLSEYDSVMLHWCEQFFTVVDQSVLKTGENHLSLSIHCTDAEIRFFFDFSGILDDIVAVRDWLESEEWDKSIVLTEMIASKSELIVELQVK